MNGVKVALEAAASEPSMKHFVYTSSAAAITLPKPNVPFTISADTYNDVSARAAWDTAHDPLKAVHVYSASKVAGEKAVWEYAEEVKPKFVLNTVVPNMNWGPLLSPERQKPSSGGLIPGIYMKGLEAAGIFKDYPPRESAPYPLFGR